MERRCDCQADLNDAVQKLLAYVEHIDAIPATTPITIPARLLISLKEAFDK